jgi:GNAT superfamily N-acetyltransferase
MAFQRAHDLPRALAPTRAARSVLNRQQKQQLVCAREAHGVLVYAAGEPIGWCQFGSADELRGPVETSCQWRITCFVVDRRHRRRGVAQVALQAALEAIGRRGGGVVEGYPIASWTHGRVGTSAAVLVAGAGLVGPAWGSFGNVSWSGTVSMFERAGFEAVAVIGSASPRVKASGAAGTQVLMRRRVARSSDSPDSFLK